MSEEPLATGWGADEPVDDSVLRQFLFNQADAVDAIGGGPGSRHERTADVALADSGGPVLSLNEALLLRPVTSSDDPVLDVVEEFFAPSAGRLVMLLSAWPLPGLAARGWQLGGHPMFMIRSPGPVPYEPPPGVEVASVQGVEQLRVLERVAIDGYPLDAARDAPAGSVFGAWSAVMWARVADAPELPTVSFTSDYSRPGFAKHGFLPVTRFTLYVRSGGG